MYSTLTPGCPTTSSPAKRQVDVAIDAVCPCKTATIAVMETESITKDCTKTVKVCTAYPDNSKYQQLTMP